MKKIKQVLMCRPTYYDVEYIINPWMKPGTVNKKLANKQWLEIVKTLRSLDVTVQILEPVPYMFDLVFAADQGIVIDNTVVLSNFKYFQRHKERFPYLQWFEKHTFDIRFIPEGYYFEGGGECLFRDERTLFVGTGFRTTQEGAKKLAEILDIETIVLELVDSRFYHLDTCLFFLNADTAFYYPPAFSSSSQQLLTEKISNLISFSEKEAMSFAANNIVVDKYVLTHKGNKSFVEKLKKLDYSAIELDVSEFIKAGGGIHCLTNILK